jgi:hypothetical protein
MYINRLVYKYYTYVSIYVSFMYKYVYIYIHIFTGDVGMAHKLVFMIICMLILLHMPLLFRIRFCDTLVVIFFK